ncbi:hypothetical protein At12D1_40800 [Agrobacterium tumefaciens]|nr:hypothetical protein At12D1_40800 [Agrobacterium tumefaciens]
MAAFGQRFLIVHRQWLCRSPAPRSLGLHVKSVKFLHSRHGTKTKMGQTYTPATCGYRWIRTVMGGTCLSGAGNPYLSVKLDDPCSALRSRPCEHGRREDRGTGADLVAPPGRQLNRPPARPCGSEASPGNCPPPPPLALGMEARRVKTVLTASAKPTARPSGQRPYLSYGKTPARIYGFDNLLLLDESAHPSLSKASIVCPAMGIFQSFRSELVPHVGKHLLWPVQRRTADAAIL